jgi:hypothetical protein
MKVYINKREDCFDANFDNEGVADLFCVAAAHFSGVHNIYGKNLFLRTGAKTYQADACQYRMPRMFTITLSEYVQLSTIDYEGFISYIEQLGVKVEYYDSKIYREEIR